MRQTRTIMGMPVTVEVAHNRAAEHDLAAAFDEFIRVDERFSPFKPTSEVSRYAQGGPATVDVSPELREILTKSAQTKRLTHGYFDVFSGGKFDPSGLVKGWAIHRVAEQLRQAGFADTYVEAGGDIQLNGHGPDGRPWQIGIRHPWQTGQMVKILRLTNRGVATSGTYERGRHIINPKTGWPADDDIVSLTVIGPNVYEADRFATAAFAMGLAGINFIQLLPGHEGYMIDRHGTASETTGWREYVVTI